uniref:Regucalcin n=1 Tax=Cacopsylla melanoneura TaxID=428564 RepID=A0A8D8TXX1_9HEMI
MVVEVKPIAGPFNLGEGPHWDEGSQSLFFVDIDGCAICKYDSASRTTTKCAIDRKVGFIIPVKDKTEQFMIGYGGDFAVVTWDGKSEKPQDLKIYAKGDPSVDNRINDGKADPTGRVYAGSMCQVKVDGIWKKESSFLYNLEKGEAKVLLDKVGLSNGLAWSLDHKKLYYIDSLMGNVRELEYNKETGRIGNPKVVYSLTSDQGSPDGMTIDVEGKLWIASFGGGRVIRVDPDTKELLLTLDIPAHQTTSVAWGGLNYDELYVTSANFPDIIPDEDKPKYTHNGYLFKVTGLGVKGLAPSQANL